MTATTAQSAPPEPPPEGALATWLLRIALGSSLVVLLAHAWHYAFLTDDAYISFRYARNWSEGAGLVFNPGFERVEGYTNFLWVVLLAAGDSAGWPPETAAIPLSLAFTVVWWAAVIGLARHIAPTRHRALAIGLAPVLLAFTPSVAVWSTSGLETRLFELLVVTGALRLLVEDARLRRGSPPGAPLAALAFALATLTRPDGALLALVPFAAVVVSRIGAWRRRLRWALGSALTFGGIVGAHLAFRWSYYGALVPNTYYAKIDGRTWWELGGPYLEAFALEYALYLWIPLAVGGAVALIRRGEAVVPLVFGAICLPHAVYVASIGGDHFEYRPLDLYFPFLFLLAAQGAAYWAGGRRRTLAIVAGVAIAAAVSFELPMRAHSQYPADFRHGFPGDFAADPVAADYLDPDRNSLHALPGLRGLAGRHRDRVRELARHFAGLRRDEHALFLTQVEPEGRALASLVERGILPRDTHIAICCVGAVPYLSRLRTLDRIGLTDAAVARGALVQPNLVAHGKSAPRSYGVQRRVDLWSVDPVHLLFDPREESFARGLRQLHALDRDVHFARVAPDRVLVAELLRGSDDANARFPALEWQSARDAAAIRALLSEVGEAVGE